MNIEVTITLTRDDHTYTRKERFEIDRDTLEDYEKLTLLSRKVAGTTSVNLLDIKRKFKNW